jgi:hypothetical protein
MNVRGALREAQRDPVDFYGAVAVAGAAGVLVNGADMIWVHIYRVAVGSCQRHEQRAEN